MKITATEQHRQGTSVLIVFELDGVKYDRYVAAADWNADQEAITANVYIYMTTQSEPPLISTALITTPIEMTTEQINDKLEEIELLKADQQNKKEPA